MIKNYFKIALRNLVKNKMHSFINVAGLSVGMAVAMLIGFWIWDELSFDKDNPNYGRIAQVEQHGTHNGEVQTREIVPYPLAAALRRNYGNDFKSVVLASRTGNAILSLDQKNITANGAYFEPAATRLLALKMKKGSGEGLQDPSSILLSASTASALFGNADPVNKTLKIDNRLVVKVTGIYEDLPLNSSFAHLAFMAPWQLFYNTSWIKDAEDPWRPNAFNVYVQLADHADMANVSAKIRDIKLKMVNKRLATFKPQVFLHPMSKWHLYAEFKNGVNTGGRIQYVWMFGIIGVFVLLLACINFMNLSTARSEKRAKEVGIRKAIGSLRTQLISQFFSESLLVVALAFLLSFLWVELSLPFFNQVAEKSMFIPWSRPAFWALGSGFCLITGLIAGCYPALYLSSFQPVKVLKGTFKVGRFAVIPRKVLVVLQFTVSVILMIGTLVVFRQIQFAKNRPVGYSRDGLVALPTVTEDIHNHFEVVKNELLNSGAIVEMAESQGPTTWVASTTSGLEWKGKDPNLAVEIPTVGSSFDYGRTIGWKFREGRDFSKEFLTDSTSLILNETAARFMGLQHPVGETIKWDGVPFKVIGIIEDMIMNSPYEQIRPTVYSLHPDAGNYVIARINPAISASEAINKIGTVFHKYNPVQPFDYQFVDDEYAKKFGNEERVGKLAGFFAFLAIFISCMGLFGMASFMAEQRIKEIGVRKVLGASVFNLWQLLSKDFVTLVIISLLIATPTAYYFMFHWLQNYHYRAEMAWWIFAVAGLGAMGITLLTVSFQAIRAAMANPIESLRSE
jgi:putative ABC transport system permease protein